jgi:hypothetical protein
LGENDFLKHRLVAVNIGLKRQSSGMHFFRCSDDIELRAGCNTPARLAILNQHRWRNLNKPRAIP